MGEKAIEKYVLQLDAKTYFQNWEEMTPAEQQEWENKIKTLKKRKNNR